MALEPLLLVDKTGTLTAGKPAVTDIVALQGSEDDLLRFAAAIERGSEHPLARAIVIAAENRHIAMPQAEGFESITGTGVLGTVDGRRVALGNAALLEGLGWLLDPRIAALAMSLSSVSVIGNALRLRRVSLLRSGAVWVVPQRDHADPDRNGSADIRGRVPCRYVVACCGVARLRARDGMHPRRR
jgi:cation transport ATPase